MKIKLITGLLAATLTFFSQQCFAAEPQRVSIIQLIATPEKYHGKSVSVSGYFVAPAEREGMAIYLSKFDAAFGITNNALAVAFSSKVAMQSGADRNPKGGVRSFDSKAVTIDGVFNKDAHGHRGLFCGSVTDIKNILELSRNEEFSLPEKRRRSE